MSGYNFTDRVRLVLQAARVEAAQLRHQCVGTEHLCLALIHAPEGAATNVLVALRADAAAIERTINATAKPGNAAAVGGRELPYTGRAKKALELAMIAARDLNHHYVGTEHLLLGVLCEKRGVGARALRDSGVTIDRVAAVLSAGVNDDVGGISAGEFIEPVGSLAKARQRLRRIFGLFVLVLVLPLHAA
jgi:ATP-dependent Clp protease ATP-binding subunit ClpC